MAEILIIADIHLSPANPQTETFAALMARAAKADALYILGDLFDYWVGDDQPLPDVIGHTLDQIAALPCKKYFQAGNRDFLVGQNLLDRIGARKSARCISAPLSGPNSPALPRRHTLHG